MERLNILYRGPLSSCNYDCNYCPFAKRHESAKELQHDQECLNRFLGWLGKRSIRQHGLFFTPWGEALTRRWYRDAIVEVSHFEHLERVAIQTNLSVPLGWLGEARVDRVGLWCTYHPGEVTRNEFLERCAELERLKVRYSVGVVGLAEHAAEIRALRAALPDHVYLWINAFKSNPVAITADVADLFEQIDPLYSFNATPHDSRGKRCNTGESTISIDGDGSVRRCHFVETILGNIYHDELETLLQPRTCPKLQCGCHIGYVHMPSAGLIDFFGDNILERIPQDEFVFNSSKSVIKSASIRRD